jgi:formate hydrogenlyase subunit 3/multisubunit Na+/H+ antiporter MnhD subunit
MYIALPIFIPIIAAVLLAFVPKKNFSLLAWATFAVSVITFIASVINFGKEVSISMPWAGFGIEFALRNFNFSSFIVAAAAAFAVLIALYSISFVNGKDYAKQFFIYLLLTLGFVCGAALSNNLVLLLFFWEGLLVMLFGMIYIGGSKSFNTAIKAFTIVGITDVTMMVGIALTAYLAQTLTISEIHIPLDALGATAFTMLMIGAIAKAGSMPFHSWIPDAAVDAPLPFMALLPAALEKLLGIYFLARISMDMFVLTQGSWVSIMMMTIGSITILFAVMMALIQKDYKRLLSYHAISQVGYMVLGIGTALPVGIVGGIFHMINHATYKSCLFLTGGSVEKQTGTTDLSKLGGLGRMMPVTFACFFVAACSISGVPPFNGFFSKELVYDAAMERGVIFYLAAVIGSFFTAASFLKLGHAAYFGQPAGQKEVKEAPLPILIPMITLASICVIFGLFNALPINGLIVPLLKDVHVAHSFAGWPASKILVLISVVVTTFAVLVHWFNAKVQGSGLKSADYIYYAPGLHQIYEAAKKRWFDPYDIGMKLVDLISKAAFYIDRGIDWIYGGLSAGAASMLSMRIRMAHNGNYSFYLVWTLLGSFGIVIFMLIGHK